MLITMCEATSIGWVVLLLTNKIVTKMFKVHHIDAPDRVYKIEVDESLLKLARKGDAHCGMKLAVKYRNYVKRVTGGRDPGKINFSDLRFDDLPRHEQINY